MNILIDVGEFGWSVSKVAPYFRGLATRKKIDIYVMSYCNRYHIYSDFLSGFAELPKKYENYIQNCLSFVGMNNKIVKNLQHRCRKVFKCRNPNFFLPWQMWKECDKGASRWLGRVFLKYTPSPLYTGFVKTLVSLDSKFIVIVPRHRDYSSKFKYIRRRNYGYHRWVKLIELLLDVDEFKEYKIVAIGHPDSSCSIKSFDRFYDLTQVHVADYSAFTIAVFSNAVMSLGTQSGGTVLSLHCGVPTFQWGHESNRHKIGENVHNVPSEFYDTENYDVEPKVLIEVIKEFWTNTRGG